jgi:Uma2 family endonuclease
MLLTLEQIVVPPGQQLILKDLSWQKFEEILAELGEKRAARVSYSKGILEIMTPLPEHEDDKTILANLIEIILEELNIEFRNLGSTTFKNANMQQAVEPDSCFYIQNEPLIRGKKRIDLAIDPPPDLAIEIDITSRTHFTNYQELGISELWRYNGTKLEIYILQHSTTYLESQNSLIFPDLPIADTLPEYIERSKVIGRNATMKEFRTWVREKISTS